MKLLVCSHPCVTPVNQAFFAEVERQTGWDLTLVVPSSWKTEYGPRQAERWPAFRGDLCPIPVLGSGNIPLHVYRATFLRLLRSVQPDAIYVHNEPYAASTAQLWLANRATQNVPMGFYSAQNIVKQYPPPFRWTEQAVYRSAQFAFPCAESVRDTLRAKGYAGPATVLPLGVDATLYAPDPSTRALRAELADGAEVLFGYVGRITEEKGLPTLLDALHQVPDALNWRLVVLGTGDWASAFDQRAAALGLTARITRLGYVEHTAVPRYYAAFDLLVVPSETQPTWKEQFGRVLVESLACGTPVVGSSSGEIPIVVRRTGGGLVFPEGQATALANRLTTLATDPEQRAALGRTGRENVRTAFTNEALARRFADTVAQTVSLPA
ncbi:MAG: glycosyltransferase family 4 protein [Salinibacter sp.]